METILQFCDKAIKPLKRSETRIGIAQRNFHLFEMIILEFQQYSSRDGLTIYTIYAAQRKKDLNQ